MELTQNTVQAHWILGQHCHTNLENIDSKRSPDIRGFFISAFTYRTTVHVR